MSKENRRPANKPPVDTTAADLQEIPGENILIARWANRVIKVSARCPHRGGPLADGRIIGTFLECPWHGATFDLRTGRRLRGPECPDLIIIDSAAEAE